MVPGPAEAGQLPLPEVDLHGLPEGAGRLHGIGRTPPLARGDRGREVGGVERGAPRVVERHGLEQAYEGEPTHRAVARAAGGHQHEAHERIHHQNLGREESGVEVADEEEQHEPPAEAAAEVAAPHPLVVVLDEEAEAEQQREDGVGLAAQQEKEPVPHGAVRKGEPGALPRGVGIGGEVEVLDGVEQQDAHDGEAAQHVGHLHAPVARSRCRNRSGVHRRIGMGLGIDPCKIAIFCRPAAPAAPQIARGMRKPGLPGGKCVSSGGQRGGGKGANGRGGGSGREKRAGGPGRTGAERSAGGPEQTNAQPRDARSE